MEYLIRERPSTLLFFWLDILLPWPRLLARPDQESPANLGLIKQFDL